MVTLTCAGDRDGTGVRPRAGAPAEDWGYGFDRYTRVQHSIYACFTYVGGPLEVGQGESQGT